MPSAPYRDDEPGSGSTVWYATGSGWWQAGGGALASGWFAGGPSVAGAPSTAATEQVSVPALPPKKNNDDFSVTPSTTDIPAYRMAAEPLWRAQGVPQASTGTEVAAGQQDRTENRVAQIDGHRKARLTILAEHIS